MREILFRGKRCDKDCWAIGFYVRLYDDKGNISHRIYPGYAESDCGNFYPDWYEVVPSTIGQFTGIADTYRTGIFEGDIVSSCDFDEVDGYGVIQWDDGAFEISNANVTATFHENHWGYEFEVIGNIHDNPELLEAVDE